MTNLAQGRRNRSTSGVVALIGLPLDAHEELSATGLGIAPFEVAVDAGDLADLRPRAVVIAADVPDLAGQVSAAQRAAPDVPVYVSCDRIELGVLEPALAAGARGILPTRGNRDALPALLARRDHALERWRSVVAPGLIGDDESLRTAIQTVYDVCDTDVTVLITGESGTGKEVFARALHDGSLRREGPFVAVNCAAIPDQLVEAELFGHTRGAFSGAVESRKGRLQAADGGTLFLDEIGDMPLPVQAKLLRVLQEGRVTPVGSDQAIAVDVRIVAATHRDLAEMAEHEQFRSDLFYRLSVVDLCLPALRERKGDILTIALHFLRAFSERHGRQLAGFDESAIRALLAHGWPGNVRELANVVHRGVAVRRSGFITARDLQLDRRLASATPRAMAAVTPPLGVTVPPGVAAAAGATAAPAAAGTTSSGDGLNLRIALEALERSLIEQALERANGNRSEAAALLGLNRTTLVEKLRKRG